MKELAAYLLALLGGKAGSSADISAIISAAGAEADSDAVSRLLTAVEGKVGSQSAAASSSGIGAQTCLSSQLLATCLFAYAKL